MIGPASRERSSGRAPVLRFGALALILLALCKASFTTPLDAAQQLPMRIMRDVPYGPHAAQRFDVYAPGAARGAPVIVMVHGGGWAFGDKSARGVVENKVARWVPRGFIVVSTNYRMLPSADPLAQAKDVARAVAMAQKLAASWGGDRTKFLLVGHSAGAHLVALLTAAPRIADQTPVTPWLGAVSIESGAMNVVDIMEGRHARLYDRAFGRDRAFWTEVSPYHALTSAGAPIALVCSTRRGSSCDQAERFAARAQALGMRAVVLRENLSHAAADAELGLDNAYTREVEAFMRSLDESVSRALAPPDSSRGTR